MYLREKIELLVLGAFLALCLGGAIIVLNQCATVRPNVLKIMGAKPEVESDPHKFNRLDCIKSVRQPDEFQPPKTEFYVITQVGKKSYEFQNIRQDDGVWYSSRDVMTFDWFERVQGSNCLTFEKVDCKTEVAPILDSILARHHAAAGQ